MQSQIQHAGVVFRHKDLLENGYRLLEIEDRRVLRSHFCSTQPYVRWLYLEGLLGRAEDLFLSYGLDRIDFSEGDLIVDVGANFGDLILAMVNMSKMSSFIYVGFEPSSLEFQVLCQNYSKNVKSNYRGLSRIENKAVGHVDAVSALYWDSSGANTSLIEPQEYEAEGQVVTVRLDSYFSAPPLEGLPIKLLKIEAEGAEPEVCSGASRILSRVSYVAVDLGHERGRLQESPAVEVFDILSAHGFSFIAYPSKRWPFRFLFGKN